MRGSSCLSGQPENSMLAPEGLMLMFCGVSIQTRYWDNFKDGEIYRVCYNMGLIDFLPGMGEDLVLDSEANRLGQMTVGSNESTI